MRHQLRGFAAGVAEHHALVARAFLVDAHGDVAGLLVEGHQHAAGVGVEPHVAGGVADLADDLADDLGDVRVGRGGHFAGDDDQAGAAERLAGHAAAGVIRQEGIEHGVRDLVGNLVGVAHRDGFGREKA
jgi:hypothetical protein